MKRPTMILALALATAGAALAVAPPTAAATESGNVGGAAPQGQLAPASAPGASRIDATEARLRKMDADAAKPAAPPKSAAQRRRERIAEQKKAAAEREAEAKRVRLAREMTCQIKPVMTDDEITHCREVWR